METFCGLDMGTCVGLLIGGLWALGVWARLWPADPFHLASRRAARVPAPPREEHWPGLLERIGLVLLGPIGWIICAGRVMACVQARDRRRCGSRRGGAVTRPPRPGQEPGDLREPRAPRGPAPAGYNHHQHYAVRQEAKRNERLYQRAKDEGLRDYVLQGNREWAERMKKAAGTQPAAPDPNDPFHF